LPIKSLSKYLVGEGIINFEDEEKIQQTSRQSEASSMALRKIAASLKASFDTLLSIMEQHGSVACVELVNQINGQLMQNIDGTV